MPYREESKKALRTAIRYLVYRDRSQHEIICYLKKKKFSTNTVIQTLAFLEENGYVDDQRFALKFGESRIEKKKMGKLRLEMELKIKGIESKIIKKAVNSLYEKYNESLYKPTKVLL